MTTYTFNQNIKEFEGDESPIGVLENYIIDYKEKLTGVDEYKIIKNDVLIIKAGAEKYSVSIIMNKDEWGENSLVELYNKSTGVAVDTTIKSIISTLKDLTKD